jgi:hypothetical protein
MWIHTSWTSLTLRRTQLTDTPDHRHITFRDMPSSWIHIMKRHTWLMDTAINGCYAWSSKVNTPSLGVSYPVESDSTAYENL